jgi:hypothetical protein
MKKNRFWLSYDFGIQGDYSLLYAWLDDMGAEDCGDAVATFLFKGARES